MQQVLFELSTGLKSSITVPIGWLDRVLSHVEQVESILRIERVQYLDNPPHWKHTKFENVPDNLLCNITERHNEWVRNVYESLASWSKTPPTDGVPLTPEQAARFWPALEMINVSPERWTAEYYENRMQHLFGIMISKESEGVTFGAKALTPRQAGAVILLLEPYLDRHDTRLSVPKGCDFLTADYEWCEKCCEAIYQGEPCNKRKCPLRDEEEG